MDNTKKRIERIEKTFANHKAKIITDNVVSIIDWRNQNGSSEYFIRYIIDKQLGSFIVQGDCGAGIATWYSNKTMKEMLSLTSDAQYFASKIKCSTDKYQYKENDILADIKEARKYALINYMDYMESEGNVTETEETALRTDWDEDDLKLLPVELQNVFNEDWNEITKLIVEAQSQPNQHFSDKLCELLNKYYTKWWENSLIIHAGRRIDERIYLWIHGFKMAMEDLEKIKLL